MGFSRQECWSGLPFPSAGDLEGLFFSDLLRTLNSLPQVWIICVCGLLFLDSVCVRVLSISLFPRARDTASAQ